MPFFKQQYWNSDAAESGWRRIDTDWLAGSSELALQLDSLTNNTSLALAYRVAEWRRAALRSGRPGRQLAVVAGSRMDGWRQSVTGPDLLKRAILYKVGHHGSHNATLQEKGLEQMENLRVAMIPVDEEMAKKKRWNNMPLDEILAALDKRARALSFAWTSRHQPPRRELSKILCPSKSLSDSTARVLGCGQIPRSNGPDTSVLRLSACNRRTTVEVQDAARNHAQFAQRSRGRCVARLCHVESDGVWVLGDAGRRAHQKCPVACG